MAPIDESGLGAALSSLYSTIMSGRAAAYGYEIVRADFHIRLLANRSIVIFAFLSLAPTGRIPKTLNYHIVITIIKINQMTPRALKPLHAQLECT